MKIEVNANDDSFVHTALRETFGQEWSDLDGPARRLVAEDFREAMYDEDEQCTAHEYARRIGSGNLCSYASVLLAQSRRYG